MTDAICEINFYLYVIYSSLIYKVLKLFYLRKCVSLVLFEIFVFLRMFFIPVKCLLEKCILLFMRIGI